MRRLLSRNYSSRFEYDWLKKPLDVATDVAVSAGSLASDVANSAGTLASDVAASAGTLASDLGESTMGALTRSGTSAIGFAALRSPGIPFWGGTELRDVQDWLLSADEEEVALILRKVAEERPALILSAASAARHAQYRERLRIERLSADGDSASEPHSSSGDEDARFTNAMTPMDNSPPGTDIINTFGPADEDVDDGSGGDALPRGRKARRHSRDSHGSRGSGRSQPGSDGGRRSSGRGSSDASPRSMALQLTLSTNSVPAGEETREETPVSNAAKRIGRLHARRLPAPQRMPRRCLLRRTPRRANLENVEVDHRAETLEIARKQLLQDLPVLQFSAPLYYCREEEGYVTLVVMRIGSRNFRSRVRYTTLDPCGWGTGAFEHTEGELLFEAGESEKEIQVKLIDDDTWGTTKEFAVDLLDSGLREAKLGQYLWHARVKVIDSNRFPTSKYDDQILSGDIDGLPALGLMVEYARLNLTVPMVYRGTVKMLALGQLKNCFFVLGLLMHVYLVDVVLRAPDEASAKETMLLFILSQVLPFAALHYFDYTVYAWGVAGKSQKFLQAAILRRFLNYTESSRNLIQENHLIMTMTRDAVLLVTDGYLGLIKVANAVGKFLTLLLIQLLVPAASGTPMRMQIIIPMLLLPLLLTLFLRWRKKKMVKFLVVQDEKYVAVTHLVTEIVKNYRLIADYHKRPNFAMEFEERVQEYNTSSKDISQLLENNAYAVHWITLLMVVFYTFSGGMEVVNGNLSLGLFLADIRILRHVGHSITGVYERLLEMQTISPELHRIVKYMNLKIDVPDRMVISRAHGKATLKMRSEFKLSKEACLPIDLLPIRLKHIVFAHARTARLGIASAGCDISFDQGQLIWLVGPRGEGKSSLLKLFGGVNLPYMRMGGDSDKAEEGRDTVQEFFIPSHLRVLHVSWDTFFLSGSLMDNLAFGTRKGHQDGSPQRIQAVCKRLGIPSYLLNEKEQTRNHAINDRGFGELAWNEVLSHSQRHLLHIARALVANPEVLCIDKPMTALDERSAERVLYVLREFVDRRGVEQDDSTWHMRSPRTCIMTATQRSGIELADQVFCVQGGEISQVLRPEDITADMLDHYRILSSI